MLVFVEGINTGNKENVLSQSRNYLSQERLSWLKYIDLYRHLTSIRRAAMQHANLSNEKCPLG